MTLLRRGRYVQYFIFTIDYINIYCLEGIIIYRHFYWLDWLFRGYIYWKINQGQKVRGENIILYCWYNFFHIGGHHYFQLILGSNMSLSSQMTGLSQLMEQKATIVHLLVQYCNTCNIVKNIKHSNGQAPVQWMQAFGQQ